jgi:hypothetical protein
MSRGFTAIGLYSPKDGANVGGAFRAAFLVALCGGDRVCRSRWRAADLEGVT